MSRRVSSRTLPIIVGIGVAVGVFGGLMIIRGTGSSSAASSEPQVLPEIGAGDDGAGADTDKRQGGEPPVLAAVDAGAPEVVATVEVDAAPVQITPPEPEKRSVTLRFKVSPKNADIEVDGKKVEDGALALELLPDQRKSVEIVVEADGYERWTKKLPIATKGDEQAVEIELKKIARTPPRRPPRTRDGGNNRRRDRDRRPGGIIDL